jgi:hypothetical protein
MAASWVACGVLLAPPPSPAQSPFTIPIDGGRLVVQLPEGWKASISGPSFGPTVRLVPAGEARFAVMFTAMPVRKGPPPDADTLLRRVRARAQQMLPTAIQEEAEIFPLKGSELTGYLSHLTDREPEKGPDDYRELHQGLATIGPLVLTITILTHPGDSSTVATATATIASARYDPDAR